MTIQLLDRTVWFCTAFIAMISVFSSSADASEPEDMPLIDLADSVKVQSKPISSDENLSFGDRRKQAVETLIAQVKEDYGNPILIDELEPSHVLISYTDKLVAITGWYSNSIICRIEIETPGLRHGFSAEEIIRMAARHCRKTEEDGWGETGLSRPTPIGTEPIEMLENAVAKIFITDQIYSLFRPLVREHEGVNEIRASLVRRAGRGEPSPREGAISWRYAWFDNGDLLILRWRNTSNSFGRQRPGIACVLVAKPLNVKRDYLKPFSNWCDANSARLAPNLDEFVETVKAYRRDLPSDDTDNVPAMYPGLHFGEFPVDITAHYWRTGKVPVEQSSN